MTTTTTSYLLYKYPLITFLNLPSIFETKYLFIYSSTLLQMGRYNVILVWSLALTLCLIPYTTFAQLSPNHYANICPNVQSIVRSAVQKKFQQTFVTVPATLRLFFHDCFVQVINFSICQLS